MLYRILIATFILITSCCQKQKVNMSVAETNQNKAEKQEQILSEEDKILDSLKGLKFDTTNYLGKISYLKNQLGIQYYPFGYDRDTLFDINYDGKKDLIFFVFALAGTGLKQGMEAYIFSPEHRCFVRDSLLSSVRNPSFFLDKKKITGFYLANGGGYCNELRYKKGRWVETKIVDVSNDNDIVDWKITNLESGKKTVIKESYFGIPPKEVLETNY